eukprot:1140025-Pelagomonas_calceolata.AAC.4
MHRLIRKKELENRFTASPSQQKSWIPASRSSSSSSSSSSGRRPISSTLSHSSAIGGGSGTGRFMRVGELPGTLGRVLPTRFPPAPPGIANSGLGSLLSLSGLGMADPGLYLAPGLDPGNGTEGGALDLGCSLDPGGLAAPVSSCSAPEKRPVLGINHAAAGAGAGGGHEEVLDPRRTSAMEGFAGGGDERQGLDLLDGGRSGRSVGLQNKGQFSPGLGPPLKAGVSDHGVAQGPGEGNGGSSAHSSISAPSASPMLPLAGPVPDFTGQLAGEPQGLGRPLLHELHQQQHDLQGGLLMSTPEDSVLEPPMPLTGHSGISGWRRGMAACLILRMVKFLAGMGHTSSEYYALRAEYDPSLAFRVSAVLAFSYSAHAPALQQQWSRPALVGTLNAAKRIKFISPCRHAAMQANQTKLFSSCEHSAMLPNQIKLLVSLQFIKGWSRQALCNAAADLFRS